MPPALARSSPLPRLPEVMPRAGTPDAPFSPSSFRERGIVLPATTPSFAFARVREAAAGREIVLRNPAGTRGAIMIPLAKAADYARPTLHDRALLADIAALPALGPAEVGAAARAASRSGLAGRSALAAAMAAGEAEGREGREALARLLVDLSGTGGGAGDADAAADPKAFALRHHEALAAEASALGLRPEAALAALAGLAPGAATAARLAALLARLRVFATTAADTALLLDDRLAAEAGFAGTAAAATAGFAEAALADVLATLAEPGAAIARAASDPGWPGSGLERAAWILDGWAALLARWEDGAGQGQAAEMRAWRAIAAAVPPLPASLATTPEERARARGTWRVQVKPVTGGNDQALLERLRVAAP